MELSVPYQGGSGPGPFRPRAEKRSLGIRILGGRRKPCFVRKEAGTRAGPLASPAYRRILSRIARRPNAPGSGRQRSTHQFMGTGVLEAEHMAQFVAEDRQQIHSPERRALWGGGKLVPFDARCKLPVIRRGGIN